MVREEIHGDFLRKFPGKADPSCVWTADVSCPSLREPPSHASIMASFKEDEELLERDIDGRKHILVDNNEDGVYVIDSRNNSTFARFPVNEGTEAVTKFRAFLQIHVPELYFEHCQDNICPAEEIAPTYLPRLQTILWGSLPRTQAAVTPAQLGELSEDDILAAKTVAWIAKVLGAGPLVFVIRDRKSLVCNSALCQRANDVPDKYTKVAVTPIISLEPIIDFGTLIPACDLNLFNNEIFIFRRDGTKYDKMGFHFDFYSRKLKSTFCADCLQFLWNHRVRGWAILNKLAHGKAERDALAQSEIGNEIMKEEDIVKNGNIPIFEDSTHESRPAGLAGNAGDFRAQLASELDGASDLRPLPRRSPRKHNSSSTKSGEMELCESIGRIESAPVTKLAFTPASTTTCFDKMPVPISLLPTEWSAVNNNIMVSSTTPPSFFAGPVTSEKELEFLSDPSHPTANMEFKGTFDGPPAGKMKCQYRVTVPTGSPVRVQYKGLTFPLPPTQDLGIVERHDGEENARGEAKEGAISHQQIITHAELAVIGKILPLSPSPSRKESPPKRNEGQGQGQEMYPSCRVIPDSEDDESADEIIDLISKAPLRIETTIASKTASAKQASQLKHSIIRVPPPPQPLPMVAYTFRDSRFPKRLVPPRVYCFCRRPANAGDQLVQCANLDCPVLWYHYNCLNKSQKISSRYNKWTCDACVASRYFAEKAKQNEAEKGNSILGGAFGAPFSDRGFLDFLMVPTLNEGLVDPYDLASSRPVGLPVVQEDEDKDEMEIVETDVEEYGYWDEEKWYEGYEDEILEDESYNDYEESLEIMRING